MENYKEESYRDLEDIRRKISEGYFGNISDEAKEQIINREKQKIKNDTEQIKPENDLLRSSRPGNNLIRYSCVTEGGNPCMNPSPIKSEHDSRKLVLFNRDCTIKWQVINSNFRDETTNMIAEEFSAVVKLMKLEHIFHMVENQNQRPHVCIRAAKTYGFYAWSFFPPYNGDLLVTRHLGELSITNIRHIFAHEIGHVLGFPHGLADREDLSLSFMAPNFNGMTSSDRYYLDLIYGMDPTGKKEEEFVKLLNPTVEYSRCLPLCDDTF